MVLMKEIIDLLSDPANLSQFSRRLQVGDLLVELSDEIEPSASTKTIESSEHIQPILAPKYTRVRNTRLCSNDSILDINNWLSSDELSFYVSPGHTPQIRQNTEVKNSWLREQEPNIIPSSPVAKFIPEKDTTSGIRQQPNQYHISDMSDLDDIHSKTSPCNHSLRGKREKENDLSRLEVVRMKRTLRVLSMNSDPIESSSPKRSPSPKKKKMKPQSQDMVAVDRSAKAWRSANKVIRRKDDILGEMVIEIALCLEKKIETDYFRSVFLLPTVRSSYLELPLISWKRRVTATYNKNDDTFEPCKLMELSERVFILFYEPGDLVTKLKNGVVSGDMERVRKKAKAQGLNSGIFILIMVPSFSEYLRKLQIAENKRYRAQTLQRLNQSQLQESASLDNADFISSSEALTLIIESEVNLEVSIFTPKTIEECIDWLHSFTFTIGNSLYDKFERNPEFSSIGAVRLGSNPKSTFLEMAKKFNLMTDPKAENLYQYYPSPLSLYKRLLENDDLGTVQGKGIVPPSVNKVMKRVFTSQDPNAVITD